MPLRVPELLVPNATAWRQWLAAEGSRKPMIWLVVARSGSAEPNLTYAEALDEALCYGWIDSGGGPRDDKTRHIRFGPRKAKSAWSKRNIGYMERLEREGRVADAGRAVVEQAKANGLWDAAYSAGDAPGDLMDAISKEPSAQAAWNVMSKKDRYAIFVRMGSLPIPSQVREKRIDAIVNKLTDQSLNQGQAQTTVAEAVVKSTSRQVIPSSKGTRSSARLAAKGVEIPSLNVHGRSP